MAEPWKSFDPPKKAPWETFGNPTPADQSASGMILPISRDAQGNTSFDSDAGILGSIKRSFTLPGEVMRGEVDMSSEEGLARALEMGATVTPANALTKGGRAVPKPPTAKQLKAAARQGYDELYETGATYDANAVRSLADDLTIRLNKEGFDENTAPATNRILKKLADPPEDGVATIQNLHAARKTFGKAGQNFNNPSDQSAAGMARSSLDEFIARGGLEEGNGGAAAKAGRLLADANANYGAGKRSDLIGGIDKSAELRAAAANSGQNIGNTVRSKVASALETPKKISGFNSTESDILKRVAEGSKSANLTRAVGNYLGGGGGLGALSASAAGAGAGALVGGPQGAAIGSAVTPLVGALSKGLSNKITQKALRQADEVVRARSPLYEKMRKASPIEALPNAKKEQLIRALLMQKMQIEQGADPRFNPQLNPNAA